MKKPRIPLVIGFVLFVVIAGIINTNVTAAGIPGAVSPSAQGAGDYAGSGLCVACHADQGTDFQNTIMGKAFGRPKSDKEKLGCESCHGPGRTHIEAGGGKETIPIRFTKDSKNTVEEKNDACLSCHERGNRL